MSEVQTQRERSKAAESLDVKLAELDAEIEQLSAEQQETEKGFVGLRHSIRIGQAINKLRDAFADPQVWDMVQSLRNSELGYLTDERSRKAGAYKSDELSEALIAGLLKGFRVVGNEINVIGGRFYGTKNGYRRLVRDLRGLSSLSIVEGDVKLNRFKGADEDSGGDAAATMTAKWTFGGQAGELTKTYRIPLNRGMGFDGIIGKAHRRIYRDVYVELTGRVSDDGEVEERAEIGESHVRTLAAGGGAEAPSTSALLSDDPPLTEQEKLGWWQTAKTIALGDEAAIKAAVKAARGVDSTTGLTMSQSRAVIARLETEFRKATP